MKQARSSGRGACSPQRHRQCPVLRQRQGATAAARRDEGVTLRPRFIWEGGRLDAGPLPFDLPASVSRFGAGHVLLPQQLRSLGDDCDSLTVGPTEAAGSGRRPTHRSCRSIALSTSFSYRNVSDLFRINAAISGCLCK